MWRIAVRLLSDTNNIASCPSSRVLNRGPISPQREYHPSSSAPKDFPSLRNNSIFVHECYSQALPHIHRHRQSSPTEQQLFTPKTHPSVSDNRILKQKSFLLGGRSKVYTQLPTRIIPVSRDCLAQGCSCLASGLSVICSHNSQRRCSELLRSRPGFWARRHSAALALSFDEHSTQEAVLSQMRASKCDYLQPRITDVHGTLNTVLWGIPMIANQMSSKPAESQSAVGNPTLSLPPLTELEFVRLSQFSNASLFEAPNVSTFYSQLEFPALEECTEEIHMLPSLSEETQVIEKQVEEAMMPQQSSTTKNISLRRRQILIETHAWQCAVEDYRKQLKDMCKNQLAPRISFMKSLLLSWFEPLTAAISAEQEGYRSGRNRVGNSYGPYLDQLPADKLAIITMHRTVAKLLTEEGHGYVRVIVPVMSIGEAVEDEVRLTCLLEEEKFKKKDAGDEQLKQQKALQKQVQKIVKQGNRRLLKRKLKEMDHNEPWSSAIRAKVGSRLLELLLQTAYIQDPESYALDGSVDVRPAFQHTKKPLVETKSALKKGLGKYVGVIQCDPSISKTFQNMARVIMVPYMPMLVKPRPWQGYRTGGHLYLPACIMRTHGAKELSDTLKQTPKRQLKAVFDALNNLGATKWRINHRVLEIVEKIWEEGGRIADIVDRADVPEPQKPETDDADVLKKWKWKVKRIKRINCELHAQRCDMELKLSVARKMKNEDHFFYPHNMDFRGRAYPLHPHLNHLGSDLCRGLLEFAEARPLRSTGLHWLKIQLANLYGNGVDKLSFEDRIAFAEKNLGSILDSAKKPLEGCRWWLSAEDPFQCLATCIEISNAMSSSDVESFMSHLPVHQDGSCNGLQHYAALGKDVLGAGLVNLTPQKKPADVYTGIAIRVKGLLEKDFEDERLGEKARQLHQQVDRKLVKQTVMTSVYGVTFIGARGQIMKRLEERANIQDDQETFNLSTYAAKTTLDALGEMFTSARVIMRWLGDCAKIIASNNQSVTWRTPLGLPVVQPYKKLRSIMVKTSLQTLRLTDRDNNMVMVRRQRTAFPPNFVHSLDSTHMMMTATECCKAGLTFAGVHDSYWTHAGDVDAMNTILREKFVELYNQPILENLLKGFQKTFPDLVFPPVPARGEFTLEEVLQSPYFFN